MEILGDILRLAAAVGIAFVAGKLIAKLKLPAILGWLIAGMAIGPHALGLLGESVLNAGWFEAAESLLECVFGLMIGTELIWKRMKKAGPQILITTLTESLGTFVLVSAVFGVLFWATGLPIYPALLLGGHRAGHGARALPFGGQQPGHGRPGDPHAHPHGRFG